MTQTVEPLAQQSADVLAFLIADIRGYTRYTLEHGDEAAAKLASQFAEIVRDTVSTEGGEVREIRGDEALAVFSSPRKALHAAVELQRRLVEEAPLLPVQVGIGLDAGEAIPVADGYRGASLNLAARLCSLAGPGEVLASETVTNLARKTEGLAYGERGLVTLKGFADPVKVMEIHSTTLTPNPSPVPRERGTVEEGLSPSPASRERGPADRGRS